MSLPATRPSMTFDERYRVIESRDVRFDGQFVTAVRTTGIYCRPSCPARTPKPANVSFFATSAAAHEAGYRACKRCLPEAAPGSPHWNLRGDVTARAMRLIADGVIEREGVPGLAARLGYSPRHLTRLLTAELGAGPLALSRAHRAHTARMLLVGTDLPAADVAFSAGFSSIRQFNDTVSEVFGMPPLQLRARRRGIHPASSAPGTIELALPYRGPLDAAGLFAWMSARALPGMEAGDARSFARTLRLPGGPASLRLTLDDSGRVRLQARLATLSDLPMAVARARRLFDLDADPLAVDGALAAAPRARPARRGGSRHPRSGRRRPARDAHPGDDRPADLRGGGAHAPDAARRCPRRAAVRRGRRRRRLGGRFPGARPPLPHHGGDRRAGTGGAARPGRADPRHHRRRGRPRHRAPGARNRRRLGRAARGAPRHAGNRARGPPTTCACA